MNILYLHSHDTGRYIEPYGYGLRSPNLLSLAREGVLFRRGFTVSPTCSPSRAALLTGTYPHQNGMIGLAHRGFSLREPREHLVTYLRECGFYTALAGVQHEAETEEELGYDEVLVAKNNSKESETIADYAVKFLRREHSAPFFLSVGFFDTHRPYPTLKEGHDGRFVRVPEILPDSAEGRLDMAGFAEGLRRFDQGVGRILETLDASAYAQDTLVICTTDHGPPFPGMKCNLNDHGTGVFLIMRGPGGFSGGRIVDEMVTHLDVFPTICELIGRSAPQRLEGRPLLSLLSGSSSLHEEIFSEINFHVGYEPQRSVRTTRYRYLRRFADISAPCLDNIDASHAKSFLCSHGLRERAIDAEQLFDLVFDPLERENLVGSPDYAETLHGLQSRLYQWMSRTSDPLLNVGIPSPLSARIEYSSLCPEVSTVS